MGKELYTKEVGRKEGRKWVPKVAGAIREKESFCDNMLCNNEITTKRFEP